VGFLVDRMTLRQVFSELFYSPLSVVFHSGSAYVYIEYIHTSWRMNNRPVDGRSSKTSSYRIDMNNNMNKQKKMRNTLF
jgi:hypothetical protein